MAHEWDHSADRQASGAIDSGEGPGQVTLGLGGWLRYTGPTGTAFIRFRDEGGRLTPSELYLPPGDLDTTVLRSLPLRAVTAFVNAPQTSNNFKVLMELFPGVDLNRAAKFFTVPFTPNHPQSWARDMYLAQKPGSGVPQVVTPDEAWTKDPEQWRQMEDPSWWEDADDGLEQLHALRSAGSVRKPEALALMPSDLKLEVPSSRPYGDDFYRAVAAMYQSVARSSNSPAMKIAEANGVPQTTVHRWVRETRRRGFLNRAEHGHAG